MNATVNQTIEAWWDAHPCNIRRGGDEAVGSQSFFDHIEANKYKVEPHIPAFANFSRWKGLRVLELGCGLGTETVNFARAGAQVVVVELSAVALKWCQRRLELEGLEAQVRLVHGDAQQLDALLQPGELFDLCWAFGSLHHMAHPLSAVAAVRPHLRPGGEFRAMVYSKLSWKRFDVLHHYGPWVPGGAEGDSAIAFRSEAATGCPVTHTYSLRQARELFEQGGFVVTQVRKCHVFRYNVEAYQQARLVVDDKWTGLSAEEVADLEEELGWHTLVVAVLMK